MKDAWLLMPATIPVSLVALGMRSWRGHDDKFKMTNCFFLFNVSSSVGQLTKKGVLLEMLH
jgi:hypothetical protein